MSQLKRSSLFLIPLFIIAVVAYFSTQRNHDDEREHTLEPVQKSAQTDDKDTTVATADEAQKSNNAGHAHSDDCAHCAAASKTSADAGPQLITNPEADYVFKKLAKLDRKTISRDTFEFLRGSKVGDPASFEIGDLRLEGEVTRVQENHPMARSYGVRLEDELGLLQVKTDAGGYLRAKVFFFDDSRIILANEALIEGQGRVLEVEEATVSDVMCAPTDTILTSTGFRSSGFAEFTSLNTTGKEKEIPQTPLAIPLLESEPGSEYVMYLDFDGELVTETDWNDFFGPIDAQPMARADEDQWINLIWQRVVEDFAPFEINVTTNVAIYDAADADKRLRVVMTSTNFIGAGGVAFLDDFRNNSPVCWVFNDSEYTCAITISHEAGHTFGLEHDGFGTEGQSNYLEYYPGHNGSYEPGWAPIMGAGFSNLPFDEVDQWSIGDYANASRAGEDDLAIIGDDVDPQLKGGGVSNGFGFRPDDFADAYDATGVGSFTITGDDVIESSGLISTTDDKDVFQFSAPAGALRFVVTTADVNSVYGELGSATAGANLAANTQLFDADGNLIAEGEPTDTNLLDSILEATVDEGVYFLSVDGGGRGDGPDTGFSDYGSLGRYSIVGELALPPLRVNGGPKQTVAIFNGSTTLDTANGTDFGFTTPNRPVTNRFLVSNGGGSGVITDLEVSIAGGAQSAFSIGNVTPDSTLQEGTLGQELEIIYNPTSTGTDTDKVIITYTALSPRSFTFDVGGAATGSLAKDNYEDNNNANDAYDLNPYEDVWLRDIEGPAFFLSDQDDWYTFTAELDDNIVQVDVAPAQDTQNVLFELVNFNGQNYEVVAIATGGRLQFIIPENYDASRRTFYIHASTTDDSTVRNAYDLRWSAVELAGLTDDLYEENDTRGEAFNITLQNNRRLTSILGLGTSKDEDWYRLDVPTDRRARMIYAAATFVEAEGDIDIELYRGSALLDFATGGGDKEVISFSEAILTENVATDFIPTGNIQISGIQPGAYYIRVIGDFAGNTYDLVFDVLEDDNYENVSVELGENDSFAAAFDLGEAIIGSFLSELDGEGSIASYASEPDDEVFINGPDEDWYKVSVPQNINLEQLTLDYQTAEGVGELLFAIHDADGQELVRTQDGSNDPGVLELNNPLSLIYYIRVSAPSDEDYLSNYDFRVNVSEIPPFIEDPQEDNYEENDNFQEPFDISSNEGRYLSSLDGYGFQLDPDWYAISVPSTAAQVRASLVFINQDGDLDLTLSKRNGPIHFRSSNGTGTETIVWDDPIPGQYALTVTGEDRGNFYNLLWDITFSEDNYEENDTFTQPFDLTGFENRLLNKLDGIAIQADDDWYKIAADADTVELRAAITFAHIEGDIDLALYNANGSLIARSISTTDNESLVYSNPPAGEYFLRVYFDNAGNEYDLSWSAITQAELDQIPDGDDFYEENDSIDSPYVLEATERRFSTNNGLGIQKDEDWFEIDVPDGNVGILVEVLFDDSLGDIDLEVYDPLGFPFALRDSVDDNEIFTINSPVPQGKYTVRVYGPNLGNDYDFYWNPFIEDIYEENDVSAEAFDISPFLGNPLSAQGVPTMSDDDWYVFTVSADRPFLSVELEYTDLDGAIDMELLDSSLNVVAVADSTDDFDAILAEVTNDTYYIRVYGDNRYNTYDLTVTVIGDDQYEENDISDDAALVTGQSPLQAVQFDDDWYQFTVTEPNNFLAVNASFVHANGNIDIFLYDSGDLVNPIGSAETTQNNESIRVPGTAGTYYIRVSGDDTNPSYSLAWTVSPDDQYEDNDTIDDATDFSGQEAIDVEGIQFDEDWFEITVDPGKISLLIDLTFIHDEGDLSLTLYDSAGEELAVENSDTDNEYLEYSVFPFGSAPETYYIKVDGVNAGTNYTLFWQTSIEDTFEGDTGNNTYLTASEVLLGSEGRRISQTIGYGGALNDDWYEVRINNGDQGIVIEALFQHSAATNIDLELFDNDRNFVARSGGFSDVERIDYRGPSGTYFLRVFGSSGENPYDLVWNSFLEGNQEIVNADPTPDIENDDPSTPRNIAFAPNNLEFLRIENQSALDEDWFTVYVAPGEDIFIVDLEFEHIYGDIDVAVYRPEPLLDDFGFPVLDDEGEPIIVGVLIEQSESVTDGEQIRVEDLQDDTTYLVCVYSYGIYDPKSEPGWLPNSFDPFAEDFSYLDEDMSVYDLGDPDKDYGGLGNTYTLRWISTNEDRFDVETEVVGDIEINDTLGTSAEPELIDQEGQLDPDGAIDDAVRTIQKTNARGELVDVDYRPFYTYGDLRQLDDDWYKFTVNTGGNHDFYVALLFSNTQANLDLFIYDGSGNLLASSETDSSNEFIELSGQGRTDYYVLVSGENLGTTYSFEVRGFFDDVYEENDTLEQADTQANITNLEGITLNGLVKRDEDLFRVDIPKHQVHLNVFATSVLAPPTGIPVEVLDAEGNSLPDGYYATGVISPEAATYYFRIGDESPLVTYNLTWSYDNEDEYDQKMVYIDPVSGEVKADNDIPLRATPLSRGRIEPPYNPEASYTDPIQELAFDYSLIANLILGDPWFDPFGHAIQEADDWYAIQAPSWELRQAQRVILNLITGEPELQTIPVLKRLYYARLALEIEFVHADGNIDLELYTPDDLVTPVARSASPNDSESIIVPTDPRDEALPYLVRVYGDNNANDYSMKWTISFDDYYEQLEDDIEANDTNDFVDMAYDLTRANGQSTEGIPLHEIEYAQDVNKDGVIDAADGGFTSRTGFGIQRTDDWYTIVVSEGATQVEVEVKFYSDNDTGYIYSPDNLDIDFELYYLAGNDGDDSTADLRKPVLVGRSIENTDDSLFEDQGLLAYRLDSSDLQLTFDITTEITESATFDVSGTGAGIYFIRIYYDNRSHPYTFTWDDIGDVDNSTDDAFITDYLNGNWSFSIPAELPADQLVNPYGNEDGDRMPNYAEFALGMNMSVADYEVIGQTIGEVDGKYYYQFEFVRNKEAKALGYEYIVEESDDLVFDGAQAVHVRTVPVPGSLNLERVTYRCSKPMDEQDKCFFRLVITEPSSAK